jgi:hypothetical protein
VIYDGGERGRFSYTYSGRFNDGAARLMYIPVSFRDSRLIDKTENGQVTMTAARQWEILDAFIDQDPYLRHNRGKVARRNGAILPWMNRFDLRIVQDILVREGANQYKLQGFFDILNLGNMISSQWGAGETAVQDNLMNFEGIDGGGDGMFTINTVPGTDVFPVTSYRPVTGLAHTWSAQFGLRISFN